MLPCRNCKCGETREARVVCPHGVNNCAAQIGQHPWQAALVFKRKTQPWCGGTLISNRYVLTAAHCLKRKSHHQIQVILGDHDWTTRRETAEIRRSVVEAISHPKFGDRATFDYDFALLKLSEPVNYNTHGHIRPACLPQSDQGDRLAGQIGTASGWGVVDPSNPSRQAKKLQTVNVKILPDAKCSGSYPARSMTHTMLCAAAKGGDACFGDSGGPFTVQDQGSAVVEGVVSWGRNCAKPQWPGVYGRVGKVLDWIHQNTKDSTFCTRDGN